MHELLLCCSETLKMRACWKKATKSTSKILQDQKEHGFSYVLNFMRKRYQELQFTASDYGGDEP